MKPCPNHDGPGIKGASTPQESAPAVSRSMYSSLLTPTPLPCSIALEALVVMNIKPCFPKLCQTGRCGAASRRLSHLAVLSWKRDGGMPSLFLLMPRPPSS